MEVDVNALRLAVDSAALVLIWLVQLVIYPVFERLDGPRFQAWHPVYTRRVTYVVLPVMLSQVAVYAYLLLTAGHWSVYANTLMIGLIWANTFFRAVPLHQQLDLAQDHLPLAKRLLVVNGWRTAGWTLVWLLTLPSVW